MVACSRTASEAEVSQILKHRDRPAVIKSETPEKVLPNLK